MNTILPYPRRRKPTPPKIVALKILVRISVILAACFFSMKSQGQKTKGPLQLADEYFAAGEYYTAAGLYGQFLHPSKKQKEVSDFPLNAKRRRIPVTGNQPKTDVLYKQAESFRLANYWEEAAAAYKECFDKDDKQYADAIYWYGVCQRSLTNYTEAEDHFKKYIAASSASTYKKQAEDEIQRISFIRQQIKRPDSVLYKVQKLDLAGSYEKGLFAPVHVKDGVFLISSTEADSVTEEGVNPYRSRLFYTTIKNGRLEVLEPVTFTNTERLANQGAATLSADGKFLYLTQWKNENGKTVSSIYYSRKTSNGWSSPALLHSVNVKGYNSKQPFCSADGKYLYFASDRPGSTGKFDIWYAMLNSDGTTGEPVNAGSMINTTEDELAPFYHTSSNTLVFSSNRKQTMGGYDLFAAQGNETGFKQPENMGHPVNSSRDDIYFFAQEDGSLLENAIFSSDRGTGCCLETYIVTKMPKNNHIQGVVYDCDDNNVAADATVILKDLTGKTWETKTNTEGKYSVDLGREKIAGLMVYVSKESYSDTESPFNTVATDESDYLTDVHTNGNICIEKKPAPVEEKIVTNIENVVTVFFDFDKSNIKPDAREKLDSIYQVLTESPTATIQISGYTDGLGSEAYNKILSDKRAKACADYLIRKGIDASRISFFSFGACCPVELELINGRDNAEGRSKNRRALINIKKE